MNLKIFLTTFSLGAVVSGLTDVFIAEVYQFIAITAVVVFDSLTGMGRALKLKDFQTNKSFISVIKLVVFWTLLAVVLTIEKGFPFASFLSEAILLPIISFQLISILKNLQLVGIINNTTLSRILLNIDKHKE